MLYKKTPCLFYNMKLCDHNYVLMNYEIWLWAWSDRRPPDIRPADCDRTNMWFLGYARLESVRLGWIFVVFLFFIFRQIFVRYIVHLVNGRRPSLSSTSLHEPRTCYFYRNIFTIIWPINWYIYEYVLRKATVQENVRKDTLLQLLLLRQCTTL